MKKSIFLIIALVFFAVGVQGQTVTENNETFTVTVDITNVSSGDGAVYIALFNTKDTYKKKKAFAAKKIEAIAQNLTVTFEVPADEYVFSVYQDENGNGKLDTKIFGIPKEKVGISNYSGKGIPGGFDDLKMELNKANPKIIISLSTI